MLQTDASIKDLGVTTTLPLVILFSLRERIRGYLIMEVCVDSQERLLHTYTTCHRKRHKRAYTISLLTVQVVSYTMHTYKVQEITPINHTVTS